MTSTSEDIKEKIMEVRFVLEGKKWKGIQLLVRNAASLAEVDATIVSENGIRKETVRVKAEDTESKIKKFMAKVDEAVAEVNG